MTVDPVMKRVSLLALLSPIALLLASCGGAKAGDSPGHNRANPAAEAKQAAYRVTDLGTFDEPWAMAFLPGTGMVLVTEKAGKLKLRHEDGKVVDVAGVPRVAYGGQGGLGDIAVGPGFASDGMVYLSWAEAGDGGRRGAAVGRARLVLEGTPRLEGLQVIWRQDPKVVSGGHFSHRIAFSPDGKYLFVSSGERQKKTPARDLAVNLGKIVRLNLDGTPAAGNPFADKGGVSAQIWSYGHRNVLGLAVDAQGRLWDLEHGPAGGDELNLVEAGSNYGWPLVSDGDNYDGSPIPRNETRPDLAGPAISWNPVIAPGDFVFYSADLFPDWKGQAVIAGMGYPGLVRVAIDGDKAREVERIALDNRIREVRQAPDGALWVLEDGEGGRLRRVAPR